jgi:hypothetical protein
MKHPPPRRFSLATQLHSLRVRFPAGSGSIVRGRLTWEQAITPHALSHTYFCRLEYSMLTYPSVYCLDPQLSLFAAGRRLPHVYTRDEPVCMCLFMRRRECWNDTKLLARVVIPLAYFWLAQFEEWLFSGAWRGGGTHDTPPEPPKQTPRFHSENEPSGGDILLAA